MEGEKPRKSAKHVEVGLRVDQDGGSTPPTSTRNRNFQRQVPGNCSDKEPYFLPDYQGNTAFVLFDRDACGDGIPVKNRRFLSEISVTLATPCRDNLPSNYPDFWKNANNHTIRERDTKFPKKLPSAFEK